MSTALLILLMVIAVSMLPKCLVTKISADTFFFFKLFWSHISLILNNVFTLSFNALLSKEEVINAIDLMEYVMGDTNTGGALLYMLVCS